MELKEKMEGILSAYQPVYPQLSSIPGGLSLEPSAPDEDDYEPGLDVPPPPPEGEDDYPNLHDTEIPPPPPEDTEIIEPLETHTSADVLYPRLFSAQQAFIPSSPSAPLLDNAIGFHPNEEIKSKREQESLEEDEEFDETNPVHLALLQEAEKEGERQAREQEKQDDLRDNPFKHHRDKQYFFSAIWHRYRSILEAYKIGDIRDASFVLKRKGLHDFAGQDPIGTSTLDLLRDLEKYPLARQGYHWITSKCLPELHKEYGEYDEGLGVVKNACRAYFIQRNVPSDLDPTQIVAEVPDMEFGRDFALELTEFVERYLRNKYPKHPKDKSIFSKLNGHHGTLVIDATLAIIHNLSYLQKEEWKTVMDKEGFNLKDHMMDLFKGPVTNYTQRFHHYLEEYSKPEGLDKVKQGLLSMFSRSKEKKEEKFDEKKEATPLKNRLK